MFRNYIKVAYRTLLRNKFYSFINIFGLATGIASFVLILMFMQDELSYDRFNSKADRIFRVVGKLDAVKGQGENSSSCPFPLGKAIVKDYPQLIDQSVRFFNFQEPSHTLKVGSKLINETRVFMADSNVFDMFDYSLAIGDKKTALADPRSIVITKELAKKYFGNVNPLGMNMYFDGITDLTVTGVFNDLPEQSHIHFDALISFKTINRFYGENMRRNWVWNPCWTYILLKPGVRPGSVLAHFPEFIAKHYPAFIKKQVTHSLQPLKDIHLHSNLDYEIEPNGSESNIYIFAAVGLFILLIACINFMNLATARSAGRSKEVGIRKVSGAYKSQLVLQFLTESLLLSFIAVFLALAFIELLLPLFNSISDKKMKLDVLHNGTLWLTIIITGFFTGIISGTYPAFFLSSFKPVQVLKGTFTSVTRSQFLRRSLVVLQFSISLVLMISTGIIYMQYRYLRSANLGYDTKQIIIVPVRPPMSKFYNDFIADVKNFKPVINVSTMNDLVGKKHNTHEYNFEGMQPGTWTYFPSLIVSEDFIRTMNMKMLAGRGFSSNYKHDDSLSVVVNEAMVKHFKWGSNDNAIGKQMFTPSGNERVIGVVQDFHYESLLNPVGPFVLDMPRPMDMPFWVRYIAVKVVPEDLTATIAFMKNDWKRHTQNYPFQYFILKDELNNQYKAENNLTRLVGYFALLAVLIACLGLFALVSFTAENRRKEIGIRKVLGASATGVSVLLSKDFLKLVLIANIVAWPVSYYLMYTWLNSFAYHVNINWFIFIAASVLTMLIAMLTVAFQSIKTAISNPVKALRYE